MGAIKHLPQKSLLLLSGIPAAGKSSFGRYLEREHAFAHYDLERDPSEWPHAELKSTWDTSRTDFVTKLKVLYQRIVLSWGFPPAYVSWVHELLAARVRLVWFSADIVQARNLFQKRAGIEVANFDIQVRDIQDAGYPNTLPCITVKGLTKAGQIRDPSKIFREVFAAP